jgi:hypothetical protein
MSNLEMVHVATRKPATQISSEDGERGKEMRNITRYREKRWDSPLCCPGFFVFLTCLELCFLIGTLISYSNVSSFLNRTNGTCAEGAESLKVHDLTVLFGLSSAIATKLCYECMRETREGDNALFVDSSDLVAVGEKTRKKFEQTSV